MLVHDAFTERNVMDNLIISEQGWQRVFQGEVIAHRKHDGSIHQHEVKPFRFWNDAQAQDVVDSTRPPDKFGVLEGRACIEGRKATRRSNFFPRSWSSSQVLAAISEAYQSRKETPTGFGKNGKVLYEGRCAAGFRIVLELDEQGRVIDAYPIISKATKQERVLFHIEHRGGRRTRYICVRCERVKEHRWVCPVGHDSPQPKRRRTIVSRLYHQARRVWFGFGRMIEHHQK
jgi:hypothetical protein